jgi:hypothetical protein
MAFVILAFIYLSLGLCSVGVISWGEGRFRWEFFDQPASENVGEYAAVVFFWPLVIFIGVLCLTVLGLSSVAGGVGEWFRRLGERGRERSVKRSVRKEGC